MRVLFAVAKDWPDLDLVRRDVLAVRERWPGADVVVFGPVTDGDGAVVESCRASGAEPVLVAVQARSTWAMVDARTRDLGPSVVMAYATRRSSVVRMVTRAARALGAVVVVDDRRGQEVPELPRDSAPPVTT